MGLFSGSPVPTKFSARGAARKVILRCLHEFDPVQGWLEEEIEIQRQDATRDRVERVRQLVEEERRKLLDKLGERWA
ncbi:MAG TPA: hypothetical protein PKA13_02520 [Geminicoccaceae bacterium]|nr:hypothetical protein [Geminicoccus sp.]HMU48619.1 hypothetical protein [Geminicoccaceae bacterium]